MTNGVVFDLKKIKSIDKRYNMASLAFEHIDKIYPGGTQAIFDFSLAVADGEALALVGPSGCGKSTLLRLIAGLEDVTAGEIITEPITSRDRKVGQRALALVVASMLDEMHLPLKVATQFPYELSAGMRQRVALARGHGAAGRRSGRDRRQDQSPAPRTRRPRRAA